MKLADLARARRLLIYRQIRQLAEAGLNHTEIARKVGMSPNRVGVVVRRMRAAGVLTK
jgi:hypothetical protein